MLPVATAYASRGGHNASHSLSDHGGGPLSADSPLLGACRAALSRHVGQPATRTWWSDKDGGPRVDPLAPLPLADAARPAAAVRFVFFVMASRPFAHETINRNVRALQRPGALAAGGNDSNLFLLHADAKMAVADLALLRARVFARPDVYWVRRPRHVMWSGASMVLALLDAMASLVARALRFEVLINLSDADLALRTDGELRAFFGRFPGRSVMSVVPRAYDPRRYKMHEGFRKFCWLECDGGAAWVVGSPTGEPLVGARVIGKSKCCWSRSAPILYTRTPLSCPNAMGALPDVFHGSQWALLQRPLVEHIVRHPVARRVVDGMEHTLLPDEAVLQTIAVNSPHRASIIANHLRFIEWPQLHGNADKYWASLGPRFHGGPMVLNVSLAQHKAFLTSAIFARKVDPTVYAGVLPVWDAWMGEKLRAEADGASAAAPRQPPIADSLMGRDPELRANVPPPTAHEHDSALGTDVPAERGGAAPAQGHGLHDHDHEEGKEVSSIVVFWVFGVLLLASGLGCIAATADCRRRAFGGTRSTPRTRPSRRMSTR